MQRINYLDNSISGKTWNCGDNVTVYQILPERYWVMDNVDENNMADYLFCDLERTDGLPKGAFLAAGCEIVVAGKNFGCGSKIVEHPIRALKAAGVKLIIAESLSRYSYRNALNLALPVLLLHDCCTFFKRGDEVEVCITTGRIKNLNSGEEYTAEPLGEFAAVMIGCGGLADFISKQGEKRYDEDRQ